MPHPETVRQAATVGKALTAPFAALYRTEVRGRDYLLGGGVSRNRTGIKLKMARRYRRW